MKTSQYFLGTFKGTPKHADILSHRLMLRAGLIRKVSSGLYAWLPTGLRVLRKIEGIVREEMDKIGAIEIILPIVQPAKLWKISGRWTEYGPELLRFQNRSHREYVLSPTHEELIAEIVSKEVVSYKELPLILYQIQNKFRDEMRPRYGMFRSREFIMKDGYSFHINLESLQNTYEVVCKAYHAIFRRIGLNYRFITANSGNIGGNISHEFHAIVNDGEDSIVCSTTSNYAESIDLAESMSPMLDIQSTSVLENMRLVKLYNVKNINNLIEEYQIPKEKVVQTCIVRAKKNFGSLFLALLIRADHEFSYAKIKKLPQVAFPLSFADEDEIYSLIGACSSFVLGPVNLSIPLIADRDVAVMTNFIAGANIKNGYFFGINWIRDLPPPMVADLRKVSSGDYSPDGTGKLNIMHSIEIGHVFQLGNRYLSALSYSIQGKNKKNVNLMMGCYGIGISRLVAVVIEQMNDKNGIIWPDTLAPFFVAIIPIDMYRSYRVAEFSERIYNELLSYKIDALFDDRNESLGVKFSDTELIGIPHSIIISDNSLSNGKVEYKKRGSKITKTIDTKDILDFLKKLLK